MTEAHLHLMLNHVPVVGVVSGFLVLTVALFRRSLYLIRASFWFFTVSAVVVIPVYLTGEGAEEVVETLGVAESVMEAHEEAAVFALVAMLVLGVLSLFGLWYFREPQLEPPRWLVGAVWVVTLGVTGVTAWTAYRGGQIRHPEIRPGFEAPAEAPTEAPGGDEAEEASGRDDRDADVGTAAPGVGPGETTAASGDTGPGGALPADAAPPPLG